jgi:c-di-GMP-binding flagellar brake protein YcgR
MTERRQHPRYRVREGEFEVISRDSKINGQLHNIGEGGLAVYYTPVGRQKAEFESIDIMAKSPDLFYLPDLACQTIYDVGALTEKRTFTGAATRLCGLKFIRLKNDQQQKLIIFIKKYGLEPPEDLD